MRKSILFILLCCIIALFAIPALAQEDTMPDMPAFTDLPAGEWTQIGTGGDTMCMYDTPYSFFVRPASEPTEKLMVYFEGGGACWDGFTCGAIGQFASQYEVGEDAPPNVGMFDFENPENPVTDYNTVFVPYCTGDVHGGDAVVTFDVPQEQLGVDFDEITVHFNGRNNSQAVLDWVYENFVAPEQIFVTGCSAGGYGATVNAPFIMEQYADVPVVHMADASVGVTPADWAGLTTWGFDKLTFLDEINPDTFNTEYMAKLAEMYPNNVVSQYTTYMDQVQVGFYGFQKGVVVDASNFLQLAVEWGTGAEERLNALNEANDNFYSYLAGGMVHCSTPLPEFYTYEYDGVTVSAWVADLLDGDGAQDVSCDLSRGQCFSAPSE
ncbi:MAG: pectinacetylesterase family protein [Anaerolineae bacterium]|nr:pectinacetylesterase family protein [Anaerolineae bacterium]